ncbi:MAG TPA: T9SS type A sorting domain-containing protein [Bacteroidales bacterium]|nr:T9SS type A sorting domain-containing protein [Bacteroidales bacterium]
MKNKIFFLVIFLMALYCMDANAQSGTNDATFNTFDHGYSAGDGASNYVYATTIQNDGKILIGGNFSSINGTHKGNIVRLNADGSNDSTFNGGSGAYNGITSISVQSDGKIIIGGNFYSYNGTTRNHIARLNSYGDLDTEFDPGTGVNMSIEATAIQGDGKIIIGGTFTFFNGIIRQHIARLNTDGSLDTTFNPGTGADSNISSIAIQADGKILIGGFFNVYNGITRNSIARLNPDGSLDPSFDPGTGGNGPVKTIVILNDGKLLAGGCFNTFNGVSRGHIARLNADGSLDEFFDPGTGADGLINTLALQQNGKIIVTGNFVSFDNRVETNIARLNYDGELDTTFNTGTGTDQGIVTTTVQNDDKIVIGGLFGVFDGKSRNYFTRLNSDGTIDTEFNKNTGANNSIHTTAIQSDGKIIIGGYFDQFNGAQRDHIARLNADGSLDTTFNPGSGANRSIYASAVQSDGKLLIGGAFDLFNGFSIKGIARLNTDGSLDTTFNPGTGTDNDVISIAIQSDGKILIGGYFGNFNGISRRSIARLNPDGSLDASFDPGTGGNGPVYKMIIQNSGKILISGCFIEFNGMSKGHIARLNPDGSLDEFFNTGTGADWGIFDMALQPDGKIIIAGNLTSFNEIPVNYIARLDKNGNLDPTFYTGTGANENIQTVVTQSDGKILVGGWFTEFNGNSIPYLVRLNYNGGIDGSFNPGNGPNMPVYSIAFQSTDRLIIGGYFTSYDGAGRNRIARILNDAGSDIEEQKAENSLLLYPNPTTGFITISSEKKMTNASVKLFDIRGKLISKKMNVNGDQFSLDISNQTAGCYIIEVIQENGINRMEVIKK